MLFSFLNKKQETLGRASILLVSLTFFGQLLSIVRDRLLAGQFGAGIELDIYYTAFRIPDLLFVFVASFFSVYILTPIITDKKRDETEDNKEEVHLFLNRLITFFSILIVFISAVLFYIYPTIVDLFFPEFTGENRDLLIYMSRVLLLSPVFLGISNIFASLNQFNRNFFPFAIAPVLYNISILFGIVFLYPIFGLPGLVYGVVLGVVAHALLSYIPTHVNGFTLKPNFNFNYEELKGIFKISLPRTASLISRQVVLLFVVVFSVSLGYGYVALFTFAFMLYSVTLSLLGATVSLASFSETSQLFSSGDVKAFGRKVADSFRYLSFWAFPATAMFLIFNNEIVKIILGTGKFDQSAQHIVSLGLFIFAFSIFFQSLSMFLSTSYFAAKRTLKPFLINVSSDIFIILSAFSLKEFYVRSETFRELINNLFNTTGLDGGVLLIITAFSVGVLLNGILSFTFFGIDYKDFRSAALTKYYKKVVPSLVISIVGYFILKFTQQFFGNSLLDVFAYSGISLFFILIIFLALSNLYGGKEYEHIKAKFNRLFKN